MSFAISVDRVPIFVVHAWRGAVAGGIGRQVAAGEAELAVAIFEFRQAMAQIVRLRILRQAGGAREPRRMRRALPRDHVIDEAAPAFKEMLLHPAEHEEWARADKLRVDIVVVHHVQMALESAGPGLLAHAEAR